MLFLFASPQVPPKHEKPRQIPRLLFSLPCLFQVRAKVVCAPLMRNKDRETSPRPSQPSTYGPYPKHRQGRMPQASLHDGGQGKLRGPAHLSCHENQLLETQQNCYSERLALPNKENARSPKRALCFKKDEIKDILWKKRVFPGA